MDTYHVELPGKFSLEQLSKAVEGEEALGTKFINSRIWVNTMNVVTNLAEFEQLDTAPDPSTGIPTFVEVLPRGVTPAWVGPMIVQGSAEGQVYLLRI